MVKVLYGSCNPGKYLEAKRVAERFKVDLLSPEMCHSPPALGHKVPSISETGITYLENVRLKARGFAAWSRMSVVADDTGLEVDALDGAPGVWSARFAGEQASMESNISKLLELLKGERNRGARFRCVVALHNEEEIAVVEDVLEGEIAEQPVGRAGFGYDCVFIVKDMGRTLAEIKEKDPNFETHRVKALKRLFKVPWFDGDLRKGR